MPRNCKFSHIHTIVAILIVVLTLASCGTSKRMSKREAPFLSGEWTSVRTSAFVQADYKGQHYEASTTMRGYRDSIAIVSVNLLLGIEAARLEATPTQLTISSKMADINASVSYSQASHLLGEEVTWRKMQELVAGVNLFKAMQVEYRKVDKQ